jgi:DNA-binding GntR family transcriptional regulator
VQESVAETEADGRKYPVTRKLTWEHKTDNVAATPRVAARLGLAAGAPAVMTRYLMTADREPVQLATSYEPAALTEGTTVALPEQGPLAGRGVVERMRSIGVEVDDITEDVAVRPALLGEAAALSIAAGAALIVVERVHYSDGQAVEFAEIVVPAERFRLRYLFPVGAG